MAGIGVDAHKYLRLVTFCNLFLQSSQKNVIKASCDFGILFAKLLLPVIFFYVDRRVAPVACTPYDIHSVAIEIVRKYLVKRSGILVLKDGLYGCRCVCVGCFCR